MLIEHPKKTESYAYSLKTNRPQTFALKFIRETKMTAITGRYQECHGREAGLILSQSLFIWLFLSCSASEKVYPFSSWCNLHVPLQIFISFLVHLLSFGSLWFMFYLCKRISTEPELARMLTKCSHSVHISERTWVKKQQSRRKHPWLIWTCQ